MKKSVIFLAITLFICSFASAQSVDEILSKYFKAIGGLDKWKSLNTVKITGSFPTPQGDISFEMYKKAPNKMKIVVSVMGQTMIPQAYDGETAWMLNPFQGNKPAKIPDDQIGEIKDDADFEDPFIDYAKKGNEVTLTGTQDIDGTKCFEIKLIKHKGDTTSESTEYYYLDTETYLPIMVKKVMISGQMTGQTLETYMSDYRDTGNGIIMPYSIDNHMNGQSIQTMTLKTIEINTGIADDEFKFPETTEQQPSTN